MSPRKLVKMANDIAAFFASDPDPAARLEGIASHLKRFWDPRMRAELLRHLDHDGAPDLAPVVTDALRLHRDKLEPAARS
jgi:formate dehydrogenase subunit delta